MAAPWSSRGQQALARRLWVSGSCRRCSITICAVATGHGHSAFTIHATSAEHVWPHFLQVVQSHPDAARVSEVQIAQSFAEAVTAAVYIERNPPQGQIMREIVEVSPIVERTAGSRFLRYFDSNPAKDCFQLVIVQCGLALERRI
jgi:hypothetical protein